MRAISTVLDVAVFVLLVAAAVGTLTLADPVESSETDADETAEVVASSTLAVEYDLQHRTRRARGTMGSLLARGAVSEATIDGAPLSSSGKEYRKRVRMATRERLAAPNRTQLTVRWEPYPNAPVRGTMTVGPEPPEGVDVHTATVTVPAPAPDSEVGSNVESYEPVGRAAATAVASALLPSNRVDASAHRESPTAIVTTRRYRTVAAETGAAVERPLARGDVETAHQRAVDALTELFVEDMRGRFDSPEAAAAALDTGSVEIVVRRWES